MRRFFYILFGLTLAGGAPVSAGDYGAAFLNIGVGGRGLAMGGALSSLTRDVNAFFWNPAGIGLIRERQVAGMTGPQFGSWSDPMATFHHAGFAFPLERGAVVAVNWVRLAVDDIPVYSELLGNSYWDRFHDPALRPTGEPEGMLSDTEDAFFVSFAFANRRVLDLGWAFHKVTVEMPVGVSLKWYRQSLGEHDASGLGVDVGAMIRAHLGEFFDVKGMGWLGMGLKLQDVTGSRMTWDTQHQDAIPLNVRSGFSYSQPLPWAKGVLILAYDHETRWRGRAHWGAEFQGFGCLALRAGTDDGELTVGAGFSVWRLQVNYAFLGHELDNLHRISCLVNLGGEAQ